MKLHERGGAAATYYYYLGQDSMQPEKKEEKPAKENAFLSAWRTKRRGGFARTGGKFKHESYTDYVSRYDTVKKSGKAVGPLLSVEDHALAERVLTRLSETNRDPVRVRELRSRLMHTGD